MLGPLGHAAHGPRLAVSIFTYSLSTSKRAGHHRSNPTLADLFGSLDVNSRSRGRQPALGYSGQPPAAKAAGESPTPALPPPSCRCRPSSAGLKPDADRTDSVLVKPLGPQDAGGPVLCKSTAGIRVL